MPPPSRERPAARVDDRHIIEHWLPKQGLELRTALRKAGREAARSVLPNATETKVFITANGRALRHFIEMRGAPEADAEIRRVTLAVLALLQAAAPNLFGDYRVAERDGVPYAATEHRKV